MIAIHGNVGDCAANMPTPSATLSRGVVRYAIEVCSAWPLTTRYMYSNQFTLITVVAASSSANSLLLRCARQSAAIAR